jgi:hypothetical protein
MRSTVEVDFDLKLKIGGLAVNLDDRSVNFVLHHTLDNSNELMISIYNSSIFHLKS